MGVVPRMFRAAPEGRPRRIGRLLVTGVVWVLLVIPVVVAVCAHMVQRGWVTDIIAGCAAQGLLAAAALGVWCLATRRWAGASVAVLAGVALATALNTPRLERATPAEVVAAGDGGVVRVLHLNVYSGNASAGALLRLILSSGADVISLLESPEPLIELIRNSAELRERYPYFYMTARSSTGWPLVLSRWPQRAGPDLDGPIGRAFPAGAEGAIVRVERPGGAFIMMQMHCMSPRTEWRWRMGNTMAGSLARRVDGPLRRFGLPIVLATDLNGSPTSERSLLIHRGSTLRRSKPVWRAGATWPAPSPWPLGLVIDDIWATPDVRVVGWRTVGIDGSDHRGVEALLLIPMGRESEVVEDADAP